MNALRWPRTVLLIFIFFVVGAIFSLRHIRTDLSVYHIIDKNFPSTESLREMKEAFPGEDNSIILVFSPRTHSFTQGDACSINKWLQNQALYNRELTGILSPFNLRRAQKEVGYLFYPELLPLHCRDEEKDTPLDLTILKSTPWYRIVTDEHTRDLAVELTFRDTIGKNNFGKFDPTPIGDTFKNLSQTLLKENKNVDAYLGGRSAFQWHFKEMVRKDIGVNFLLLIVIMLFFRIFYGTWKCGAYLVSMIMVSALITYGAMAFAGHPIDVLSNGLFFMICVASLEDFLFVAQDYLINPHGTVSPFQKFIIPSFFTSLTTMIGFGSLYLADLKIIQRFGLWAAVAALVEWLTIFFVLPVILKIFSVQNITEPAKAWKPQFVEKIGRTKLKPWVAGLSLLLFSLSFFGFFHLNIDDSPRSNFSKNHPNSVALKYLKESRGWEGSLVVIFNKDDESVNTPILQKIANSENIALVDSPYEGINFFTQKQDPETSRLIRQEVSLGGFNKTYFAENGMVRATLYLKSFDLKHINETVKYIEDICPIGICKATGEGVVYAEYSNKVSKTLFDSFIASLILVGLVLVGLSWAFPIKTKLAILLSAFWGPVVMIGAISLFHIPLNLITSIFASILVGLTGDNAVQYIFASEGQNLLVGIKKRGLTSIHLAILMCLSSLMFLGLTLVPMKLLGILLFFGFIACLIGDLVLLKSFTQELNEGASLTELHPTLEK